MRWQREPDSTSPVSGDLSPGCSSVDELPATPGSRWSCRISTTTFIVRSSQATDSIWFFVADALHVIEWQRAFGEGVPIPPSDEMSPSFKSLIDSLQVIELEP
jgi:hypothetical protein